MIFTTKSGDTHLQIRYGGLTGDALKLIALCTMLIDHLAFAFVRTNSLPGVLMHIIGSMTIPIFCFFIAEGYYKTHNLKQYAIRLGLFALLSYAPFLFFVAGYTGHPITTSSFLELNILFTLLLGLLALYIQDLIRPLWLRILLTVLICVVAMVGDGQCFTVLFILAFGRNRGQFKQQAFWASLVSIAMLLYYSIPYIQLFFVAAGGSGVQSLVDAGIIYQIPSILDYFADAGNLLGQFLALPLLLLYNGRRGFGPRFKWIFYCFYPAHLILLCLLMRFFR